MARRTSPPSRTAPAVVTAAGAVPPMAAKQVSGNPATIAGSASVYRAGRKTAPNQDRHSIAQPWQVEVYRHVNICGEARYSATLFAAMAGRAELGVSEPQALRGKATWVNTGPEVDALAELCPTVRERTKLIRDYMLHRTIAGECYLIARKRVETDPGYVSPPEVGPDGEAFEGTWDQFTALYGEVVDLLDPDSPLAEDFVDPNAPIWEIVAVTEIRKIGDTWEVRHDNGNYLALSPTDPVIRLWNPDPENRREAWSPFRALLPTLKEIEWLTAHIFTQVRSRLMSAGVWFLPNDMTFPAPPSDSIEGGAEAIAQMNEAEQFMLSLAASGMSALDADEVAFPSIVMADPAALAAIDQAKLIQFWSEIDDKAMILRSDAVRRFALGMDLPPEQVLGSSGLAVSNSGGSAGSVNHWGEWAKEEQTISAHIEPALDDFVGALTEGFLRLAVEGTTLVLAYDTASLRLRQDRSAEAMQWYDRGVLKAEVALREGGFDPKTDMMDEKEHRTWLLNRIAGGSATPEQVHAALVLLGVPMPAPLEAPRSGTDGIDDRPAPQLPDTVNPNSDRIDVKGPPQGDHDHNPAPFSATAAASEVLVLRAMEKFGNRLLNDGKRGKDRDRTTPTHLAHLTASLNRTVSSTEFDFGLAPTVLGHLPAADQARIQGELARFCADLTNQGEAYTREGLLAAVKGL